MEALAQQPSFSEEATRPASTQQISATSSAPASEPAASPETQPKATLPTAALRPHLAPLQQQRRQRRRNSQAQAQPHNAAEAQQASYGGTALSATGVVVASGRGGQGVDDQDPDAWLVRSPEALQGILPVPVSPLQLAKGAGKTHVARRKTPAAAGVQQQATTEHTDGSSLQAGLQEQAHARPQEQAQQQQQQQAPMHHEAHQQLAVSSSGTREHSRRGAGSKSSSSSPERRQRRAQASGRSLLLPR